MNIGYQREDARIIDYALWRLPGIDLDLRGPMPTLEPGGYVVAIGAAQTFGRFVPEPYSALLSRRLGVPVLNLGISGAGPSFFLQRPELLRVINQARLAIVQVMSGRSTSNSRLEVQANQGVVKPVGAPPEAKGVYAETAYLELLAKAPAEDLAALRAEIRARALAEMRALLGRIRVPRVLLWFSARQPDYPENLRDLAGYWAGFPHFLNGGVLDALAPHAEAVVHAISDAGLPQPLFDRETGEPVELWPESRFPNVKLRHHNHYYPSPEMHAVAAEALAEPVAGLLAAPPASLAAPALISGVREVLVHVHIFKNAGMSLDSLLADSFGEGFATLDPPDERFAWTDADLLPRLREQPGLRCLASHQLQQPLTGDGEIRLLPFFLLRHPIDRLRSVYDYERRPDRVESFRHQVGQWANELDFQGFVQRCRRWPNTRRIVSNFQTGVLGRLGNLPEQRADPRWEWMQPVREEDLLRAMAFMETLPAVGVVERFDESVSALRRAHALRFPELIQRPVRVNVSREAAPLPQKLAEIRAEVGDAFYDSLLQDNAMDLALWQAANARLG